MNSVLGFILFLTATFLGMNSWASSHSQNEWQGYTQDVAGERSQEYYEIYLVPPYRETQADYRGVVFNHQLTTEFRQRYVERFGYIDTQAANYSANKFTQYEAMGRTQSVEGWNAERRAYGEYLVRRLGEWHLDNFVKSEPSVRPLYEAKERLSNVQVEMGKQTRAKMTYSVSDNSAELILENPYCDSKLRVEMDPKNFGPTNIIENRLYVGKAVNKRLYLNSYIAEKDGIAQFEVQRSIGPAMGTLYYFSTPFREQGYTPRQSNVGAGFFHTF